MIGQSETRNRVEFKYCWRNAEMLDVLVSILFCFFFVPFRLYLLWFNYKGRFRYGLREHSPVWRTLDRKIGVFSLVFDFFLSIVIVIVLSVFIDLVFDVGTEIALAFVLFGAIGWTFVNMATDKISVEGFEKNCLQCKHKEECMKFHHENCSIEAMKQRLKSAIFYEIIRESEKGREGAR